MPRPSHKPRKAERIALLCALAAVSCATILCWVLAAYDSVNGTTVVVLRPSVRDGLYTAAMAAMASPLLLAVVALVRRHWAVGVLSVLAVPLLFMASFITSLFVNPAPYRFEGRTVAADGEAYYFGESSFMQGQLLGIFREVDAGHFTITGKQIVLTNGDSPRMTGKMVRPAADVHEDHYHRLYRSPDGSIIVGNRYDNCAYLALDVTNKIGWTHTEMNFDSENPQQRPINTLSPFVLIGTDDELFEPDVKDLLDQTSRCAQSDPSNLPDAVFDAAAHHPNRRVREVAAELKKQRNQAE